MIQRLRNLFIDFWVVLAFGLAASLLMPQAHAGLIGHGVTSSGRGGR